MGGAAARRPSPHLTPALSAPRSGEGDLRKGIEPQWQGRKFADAIVVLGCPAPGALKRRLEHGIQLFHEGAAPLLLLSGGGDGPVPEAEIMRQLALARGMLKSAFLVEPASRNTVENAREAARLLRPQGRNTVLLVSDRSHLPRAILLFRLTGLRVAGWAGVPPRSLLWETGAAIREFAALPGSLLRALFGADRAITTS